MATVCRRQEGFWDVFVTQVADVTFTSPPCWKTDPISVIYMKSGGFISFHIITADIKAFQHF